MTIVVTNPILNSCEKFTISVCAKHIALHGLAAGKNTLALQLNINKTANAATFIPGSVADKILAKEINKAPTTILLAKFVITALDININITHTINGNDIATADKLLLKNNFIPVLSAISAVAIGNKITTKK